MMFIIFEALDDRAPHLFVADFGLGDQQQAGGSGIADRKRLEPGDLRRVMEAASLLLFNLRIVR